MALGMAEEALYHIKMETKWLEDFISLAETRSFSRSAGLRHVTQPAFSRRIQSLEAWVGADLIDRTSYPTSLTPAGEVFHAQAMEMLGQINNVRDLLQGKRRQAQNTIAFALPHGLSLTFMPKWVAGLQAELGRLNVGLTAMNVHDAMLAMNEGGCDLLLSYHHPRHPVPLDPARFDAIVLGSDILRPFVRCDKLGQPLMSLPGMAHAPLTYLAYSSSAYLGRVVDMLLADAREKPQLEKCYESNIAEGLKMMALEGQGIAFLPESGVASEVRQKLLARADADRTDWQVEIEIRLYRERATLQRPGKQIVSRLWNFLLARNGSAGVARQERRKAAAKVA